MTTARGLSSERIIPIVGRLLPNILSTTLKIVRKVDEVKINKRQCRTLTERIQVVTSYLQTPELLKRVKLNNDPLQRTFENFQRFLELCLDYISTFVDRSKIRKFISSSSHKEEFNLLNNQLQMYYSELTLGVNIQNLINNQQDQSDQNEDLHEILTIIIEQQKTVIEQQNIVFQHQTKRFDQLEQMLVQKNVQPQLEYQQKKKSTISEDRFKNGVWSNRCFEYGKWHGPLQ
jgi:glycerophosphoryl diester phosphodiesterase